MRSEGKPFLGIRGGKCEGEGKAKNHWRNALTTIRAALTEFPAVRDWKWLLPAGPCRTAD